MGMFARSGAPGGTHRQSKQGAHTGRVNRGHTPAEQTRGTHRQGKRGAHTGRAHGGHTQAGHTRGTHRLVAGRKGFAFPSPTAPQFEVPGATGASRLPARHFRQHR